MIILEPVHYPDNVIELFESGGIPQDQIQADNGCNPKAFGKLYVARRCRKHGDTLKLVHEDCVCIYCREDQEHRQRIMYARYWDRFGDQRGRDRAASFGNYAEIIASADILALLEDQSHRCASCGIHQRAAGKSLQMDHVVSLAMGGTHTLSNLQGLCAPCNYSKGCK